MPTRRLSCPGVSRTILATPDANGSLPNSSSAANRTASSDRCARELESRDAGGVAILFENGRRISKSTFVGPFIVRVRSHEKVRRSLRCGNPVGAHALIDSADLVPQLRRRLAGRYSVLFRPKPNAHPA